MCLVAAVSDSAGLSDLVPITSLTPFFTTAPLCSPAATLASLLVLQHAKEVRKGLRPAVHSAWTSRDVPVAYHSPLQGL